MAHNPVHLVKEGSEVLSSSRNLDILNLLDGSHPSMVEVGRVDDRRSLDDGYALDDISKLDNLLDAHMDIPRVHGSINDDISVHIHTQPHESRPRQLGTN